MLNSKQIREELDNFEDSADGYESDLRSSFTELVMRELDKLGWKQKDLAEKASMTEPFLSRVMSGTSNYELRTVAKILHALGTPAEFFPVPPKLSDRKAVWLGGGKAIPDPKNPH